MRRIGSTFAILLVALVVVRLGLERAEAGWTRELLESRGSVEGRQADRLLQSGQMAETGLIRKLLRRKLRNRRGDPQQGSQQETPAGLERVQFDYRGDPRSFYIHIPPSARGGKALPAVLVFHGGGGDGAKVADQTGMVGVADRYGFVVIFPNASGGNWNDGRDTTGGGPDDVGFTLALIDLVAQRWNVDRNRVFATGPSNGGMFTQRLACDASDRFAAFASVVANLPVAYQSRCRPSKPAPMILVNGTKDPLMPWGGGTIKSSPLLGRGKGGDVISAPDTLGFWLNADGCARNVSISNLPDRADDGTRIVRHAYTQCSGGAQVILYEVQGGGHTWPGSDAFKRTRITGVVSKDMDASEVIAEFFRRYGL